jgi:hypothetical protein
VYGWQITRAVAAGAPQKQVDHVQQDALLAHADEEQSNNAGTILEELGISNVLQPIEHQSAADGNSSVPMPRVTGMSSSSGGRHASQAAHQASQCADNTVISAVMQDAVVPDRMQHNCVEDELHIQFCLSASFELDL